MALNQSRSKLLRKNRTLAEKGTWGEQGRVLAARAGPYCAPNNISSALSGNLAYLSTIFVGKVSVIFVTISKL
uniref:Uncharacterized protein n=1 Tax=Romanomermis culicivorax TaxID=13658 RepID=A0A915JAA9_ROMCU